MALYRQTFRRHRALLIAPVLIAIVMAGWFSFGAPPSYESTASLWVDNGAAIASSMGNTAASSTGAAGGPAALESQVITELLRTPTFDMAVARGSLLPGFLASGASAGGFSPSVLLARRAPVARALADGSAASAIAAQVIATAPGPQILRLSYAGASPAVARSVLQSVIRQSGAGAMFGESIAKTASSFFRSRLESAASLLSGNQQALARYTRAHPRATTASDATVRALSNEVRLAQNQLASIQAASQQANTEAQVNGGAATLKVIDSPSLPSGPVKGLSTQLMGLVAGAFAGLVMSLLSLYALTPRAPLRWDAEMPLFARMTALDLTGRYARARTQARRRATRQAARVRQPPAPQEGS